MKQRSKNSRPLFSLFRNKCKQRSWRAKSASFSFSHKTTIKLTLRRFRTKVKNRAKIERQLITQTNILGIREIVLTIDTRKRPLKTKGYHVVLRPMSIGIITIGISGFGYFGLRFTGAFHIDPPQVSATVGQTPFIKNANKDDEPDEQRVLPESIPTQLSIPTIDVEALIHDVGVQENGVIETPELFSDKVGWYKHGPTPGELGPSVLVGHVDTYEGPSVFWNLTMLKKGDTISIERRDNTTAEFRVTEIVQFARDEFDTEKVYGNIDYAGLRVITCGGTFNHATGYYSHNTVVFAELVI